MKYIFAIILFLALCGQARAETATSSLSLMTVTAGSESATGDVKFASSTRDVAIQSFACRATATPVSGTLPTLDLKIQTCRTTDPTSCVDLCNFTQCTTGTCFTSGTEVLFNLYPQPVYPFFRAVASFGGTTPVYSYQVFLDY